MAGVELKKVDGEESGMRLDRWFKQHYPGLGFGALQKLLRSGQVRVDGKRVKSETRIQAGQEVRVPPLNGVDEKKSGPLTKQSIKSLGDSDVLSAMVLHDDAKLVVFNKPAGLAVQGGSGIERHVDGMLEAWRNKKGEKPRLVHRLDRDTTGVLVVAKSRSAAQFLANAFRKRDTEKTYWALCKGVPRQKEGRISNYLVKEATEDGDRMFVTRHGDKGAEHAVTEYRVVSQAGPTLSWLELTPETGRTHQLRIHTLDMGHQIIGDPKYFDGDPNWDFPGGIQKRLHLHARRLSIPHPSGGILVVEAPMPPHMVQSWNLLGFEENDAEEEDA